MEHEERKEELTKQLKEDLDQSIELVTRLAMCNEYYKKLGLNKPLIIVFGDEMEVLDPKNLYIKVEDGNTRRFS